jgi:2-phosphoglycolate phosphatase
MAPLRPRPLVFDLDGTLIDSRGDIAAACNHTLSAHSLPELTTAQISAHVGNGARALLRGVLSEFMGSNELELIDERALMKTFQIYYLEHPTTHNYIMPGTEAALALREARPIALCTNKPAHLTAAVLHSLGWTESFDCVNAPGPLDPVKPHAAPLLRVAEELGVEASSLIMIGDGPQDVGAGRAVGAVTIGIKGGFLPLSRLTASEPDLLLESLLELPEALRTFT